MAKKASSEKYGRHIYGSFFALFILMAVGLQSCADINENEPAQPATPSGDYAEITLTLPFVGFGDNLSTRDEYREPVEEQEGTLSSLYLVIFKKEEVEGDAGGDSSSDNFTYLHFQDISNNSEAGQDQNSGITINGTMSGPLKGNYNDDNKVTIRIPEGTYKFYLLANIVDYWINVNLGNSRSDFENFIKIEENIKTLKIGYTNSGIPANNLPMICRYKEFCSDDQGTILMEGEEEGILTITANDIKDNIKKTIYAPLTILCSKVRYTLLWDKEKSNFTTADLNFTDAKDDGGYQDYKENGVSVSSVMSETLLTPVTDNNAQIIEGGLTGRITKTMYPNENDDKEKGYFDIANQTSAPSYLTLINTSDEDQTNDNWTEPDKRRAWQGVIYLPENTDATDSDNQKVTTLYFSPTGAGVSLNDYQVKLDNLQRSYFYDVVLMFKTSYSYDVSIFVKAKPWKYNPSEIEGW
ncbi:MAG: hypothetical protein J1E82_08555 [Muribaculaceae bacterium]|nr:hypothetical protein [Muribaculaceae bacterium]